MGGGESRSFAPGVLASGLSGLASGLSGLASGLYCIERLEDGPERGRVGRSVLVTVGPTIDLGRGEMEPVG